MQKFIFLSILLLVFAQTLAQKVESVNNSSIAFTISEKDLLPENIAYNPNEKAFYVGSTRKGKIIKIDSHGKQSTFVEGSVHGQWMIIGMKVDIKRSALWVCSSGGENLAGYNKKDDKEGRPAGIFKFDLTSGRLLKKYTLEKSGEVHFLNDIVIADNGDIYITHMFENQAVYKIDHIKDKLEIYVQSDLIKYPNGLDISDDGSYLFIAHAEGISRINLRSKEVKNLTAPKEVKISKKESIDGLYYYGNSLIGVQSDLKAVSQYQLNDRQDEIINARTLENHHPMMDHPTTGVLVKDSFYYIANSQFEKFNEDGSLFPTEKLYEVVILKLDLK